MKHLKKQNLRPLNLFFKAISKETRDHLPTSGSYISSIWSSLLSRIGMVK